MRHRVGGRQLGRNTSHRRALFRTLVTSVLDKEKIETTVEKAKEIRPMVEKMITFGKRGDLNSRRIAASFISTRDVVKKLFDTIAPRFKDRNGGYTRIIRTRRRVGDGAEMAVIELLGEAKPEEKKEEKKTTAKKAKVEAKAKAEKPAKKEKEAKPKSKEAKAPKTEKAKEKPKEKTKKKTKEKEPPQ
ncbi:MAG: 50S ribosomal protein L17 [Nitrospirae bacterium]|nr:50S ribosomal protein L17 [Nitrospirota bacterium]